MAIVLRSARRQTVRQTCRWADAGVPPGMTKEWSGGRCSLTSSQACSSHAVYSGPTRSRRAPLLALPLGGRWDREVGADIEQVVLHPPEPAGEPLGHPGGEQRHADGRVQLVHRAIRLDPRMELRDTAHIAEVGLSAVSELGVDPGQVDGHRISSVAHRDGGHPWDRIRSRTSYADRSTEGDSGGRAQGCPGARGDRQAQGQGPGGRRSEWGRRRRSAERCRLHCSRRHGFTRRRAGMGL